MVDIFISYPRAERARAERIKQKLEALQLDLFFDLEGIDGGAEFPEVINRALRSCKAVLACWSPLYFTRKWCMIECRFAAGEEPSILVPIVTEKLQRRDIDVDFLSTNYFDLSAWSGEDAHEDWNRTLRSLGKLVGRELAPELKKGLFGGVKVEAPAPVAPAAAAARADIVADLKDTWRNFPAREDEAAVERFLGRVRTAAAGSGLEFEVEHHLDELRRRRAEREAREAAEAAARLEAVRRAEEKARQEAVERSRREAEEERQRRVLEAAVANAQGPNLETQMTAARARLEEPLIEALTHVAAVIKDVGEARFSQRVDALREHIKSQSFRIVVVGRFKKGKSSLINALLRSKTHTKGANGLDGPLPVDDLPCTAVLTNLLYSREPFARAVLRNGKKELWPFEDYFTKARVFEKDGGTSNFWQDVREFEVGWPSDLLRSGIILIDTPGASENPDSLSTTLSALAEADAAVIVYRSDQLSALEETYFAEEIANHVGKVFKVVNTWSGMPPENRLIEVTHKILGAEPSDSPRDHEIFFVDVKAAERAVLSGDAAQYAGSGLKAFHDRFLKFILTEGYQQKLTNCIQRAKGIVSQLQLVSGQDSRFDVRTAETLQLATRLLDVATSNFHR